jgi:hypothetical protein
MVKRSGQGGRWVVERWECGRRLMEERCCRRLVLSMKFMRK